MCFFVGDFLRKFEKIVFDQFSKDINDDKSLYDEYILPRRATMFSAGYDFFALFDICIEPGEVKKVPTGIKAIMNDDEALFLYVRSSMGFKYNVRLTNQVGIVDRDYYGNPSNDGHIWVSLQNHGDSDFVIKKGTAFCQGIFMKYLLTDDDSCEAVRVSGIGSTNKEG